MRMFDRDKVKLGIAPIAWTNDDLPELGGENTFEQCVSEMALAGFTGSEVGNKYPKDPEVLKRALELRGLEICNQWFSSFLLTKPFEEVEKDFRSRLAFLKAMGAKVIGSLRLFRGTWGGKYGDSLCDRHCKQHTASGIPRRYLCFQTARSGAAAVGAEQQSGGDDQ